MGCERPGGGYSSLDQGKFIAKLVSLADGGTPKPVSDALLTCGCVNFSPDGKFIAFQTQPTTGGAIVIRILNAETLQKVGELQRDPRAGGEIRYAMDGRYIGYFVREKGLFALWVSTGPSTTKRSSPIAWLTRPSRSPISAATTVCRALNTYSLTRFQPAVYLTLALLLMKSAHGPAKAYNEIVKREQPVTSCTECGGVGYNIRVANGRCCKTVAGQRCNGSNFSALNDSDWEECSNCLATGYYRNKECPQCRGAGYLFVRPGSPARAFA